MFVIPIQINPAEYSIYVFLQDDNIERIHAYDPAEVTRDKLGMCRGKLRDVVIGYATEADFNHVVKLLNDKVDVREALRFLTRGFKYRPEKGDHDGPYLSGLKDDKATKQ